MLLSTYSEVFTEKAPCASVSQEIGLSLYNHLNQTSFPFAILYWPFCFPMISTPTEEFPGALKEGRAHVAFL